jgi:hypothetical protein
MMTKTGEIDHVTVYLFEFHGAPCFPLSSIERAANMGKSKKTARTGRPKLKELRDQVDGLGNEVREIERELFPSRY